MEFIPGFLRYSWSVSQHILHKAVKEMPGVGKVIVIQSSNATAKVGDKRVAVCGEILLDNISNYQITESGLTLQSTVKGTKYLKDEEIKLGSTYFRFHVI